MSIIFSTGSFANIIRAADHRGQRAELVKFGPKAGVKALGRLAGSAAPLEIPEQAMQIVYTDITGWDQQGAPDQLLASSWIRGIMLP